MIRPSAGTARILGLNSIQMETPPTCAYLMLGNRCNGRCSFCGQSYNAKKSDFLSRITWKPHNKEEVLSAVAACYNKGLLQRACFQTVKDGDYFNRTIDAVKSLRALSGIPICVSINGVDFEQICRIFDAGAQKTAFSFDCATEELYGRLKDSDYKALYSLYERAADAFPGRIAVHLIIGMGESEKEAVSAMEDFYRHGTDVSLFAFTPLKGTPMADHPAPSYDSYRRLQIVHYMMRNGLNKIHTLDEKGRIHFTGDAENFLIKTIPGQAFETYGCSGCNRPNYNEKPGQLPYNYPRPLTEDERIEAIRTALFLCSVCKENL